MEAHALEDDQNNVDKSNWLSILGQGAIRFLVVAPLSLIVSILWMVRISGGWSFEPLTWLTMLWSVFFLTLHELIELRGKIRLSTMAILVLLLATVIMFPFTGIRLSHWRSEFLRINRDDIDDRGLLQDAEQSKRHPWERIFHWKRLPDDRLVPYCLAWRLDRSGLQPIAEVPVSVLSKKRWPEQLLEDLTWLSISEEECRSFSSDSIRVLESNLQAMKSLSYLKLTKRTEAGPRNSLLIEENATAGFVEYALQRIGSLDRLEDLHIEEQCLTLDHLHTILSLPKLKSLQLESDLIFNEGSLAADNIYNISSLEITSTKFSDPENLQQLLRACPRLFRLWLDYDLMTQEISSSLSNSIFLSTLGFNTTQSQIDLERMMQKIGLLRFTVKQGISVYLSQGVIDELPKGKVETAIVHFAYVQLSRNALRDLFFTQDIEVDYMMGQLTTKKAHWPELLDQLRETMNDSEVTQLKDWFGDKSLHINRAWDTDVRQDWGYLHPDEYKELESDIRQLLLRWMKAQSFPNGDSRVERIMRLEIWE